MSTKHYFPLDIKSAKMYGITKWQKEFFWPVSYQSYMQMETEIKQALNECMEESIDKELSELLLINYKIFLEYSNFLYSLRVLKEVHKDGLTPLYSDESINFKGIIENGVPLRSILAVSFFQRENVFKRLKTQARLTKWTLKLNRSITSVWKSLFCKMPFVANNSSLNNLALEYIRTKLDGGVTLKDIQHWYPRSYNSKLTLNQEAKILALTEEIVQRIQKIADRYALKLTELQLTYLHNVTLELFQATMIGLIALKSHVSRLKPMHLLIGSGGNHFARMLSIAVRDNGGTVTGFKHGEPVIYLCDYYSWIELSTIDRFITYTENSARAMETVLNKYPPLIANHVKIEGAATRMFYDLWHKESKKPLPAKIERVMVIAKGLQFDNKISYGIALPQLLQIDLELRIINILKEAGYKVIYKNHPDGDLSDNIIDFFGSNVQIVSERLEEVMNCAEAFLFYHSRSTTFGQALCTNKPIIYINGGWEVWLPEIYKLIAKRCHIVSAHFDERNRLIINEEELLDALTRKLTKPNTEFIKKYMLPDCLKV